MNNQVCQQMIEQRGYELFDIEEDLIIAQKGDGKKVHFIFIKDDKFNIEHIKNYIGALKKEKIKHVIFIYHEITPATNKLIKNMVEFKIELFKYNELSYNVTKHRLVPEHKRVSKDDIPYLNIETNKLPIMLKSDMVARFYCFEKGDIIEIKRKNGFITYRQVK